MTLRLKLILLFVFLGLAPVLLAGYLEQAQATRSLENLVGTRTAELARRSAAAIQIRHAAVLADLRLFGENSASLMWLRHRLPMDPGESANDPRSAGHDPGVTPSDPGAAATAFLSSAWDHLSGSFVWIELVDGEGVPLLRLGDSPGIPGAVHRPFASIEYPVKDADGSELGLVRASVDAEVLLDADALANAFGS